MSWEFQQLKQQAADDFAKVSDARSLEDFRIAYLGKKGLVAEIYASLAAAPKEDNMAKSRSRMVPKTAVSRSRPF